MPGVDFPLLICPIKGTEIIPDESVLRLAVPSPVNCPACGEDHLFDPGNRQFVEPDGTSSPPPAP